MILEQEILSSNVAFVKNKLSLVYIVGLGKAYQVATHTTIRDGEALRI